MVKSLQGSEVKRVELSSKEKWKDVHVGGCVASCGSIGVEWFGNAVNCSYGIVNHQRLHVNTHTNRR